VLQEERKQFTRSSTERHSIPLRRRGGGGINGGNRVGGGAKGTKQSPSSSIGGIAIAKNSSHIAVCGKGGNEERGRQKVQRCSSQGRPLSVLVCGSQSRGKEASVPDSSSGVCPRRKVRVEKAPQRKGEKHWESGLSAEIPLGSQQKVGVSLPPNASPEGKGRGRKRDSWKVK